MAGIKELRVVRTASDDLDKVQQNVQLWAKPITDCQPINGILLLAIDLVSGQANNIAHKLGRPYVGWFVSRQRASASVWEETSALPSKNLILQTSADVTIDLWVF